MTSRSLQPLSSRYDSRIHDSDMYNHETHLFNLPTYSRMTLRPLPATSPRFGLFTFHSFPILMVACLVALILCCNLPVCTTDLEPLFARCLVHFRENAATWLGCTGCLPFWFHHLDVDGIWECVLWTLDFSIHVLLPRSASTELALLRSLWISFGRSDGRITGRSWCLMNAGVYTSNDGFTTSALLFPPACFFKCYASLRFYQLASGRVCICFAPLVLPDVARAFSLGYEQVSQTSLASSLSSTNRTKM